MPFSRATGAWVGLWLGEYVRSEDCGGTANRRMGRGLLRGLVDRPEEAPLMDRDLCPCCAMSMARLTGTGEPPSVTLSTSIDLRSGLLLLCLVKSGESTRFLGGSISFLGGRF